MYECAEKNEHKSKIKTTTVPHGTDYAGIEAEDWAGIMGGAVAVAGGAIELSAKWSQQQCAARSNSALPGHIRNTYEGVYVCVWVDMDG